MLDNSLYLKKNVGPVDRVIRLAVGVGLVVVPPVFIRSPWAITILAALGGAHILEGAISY